MAAAGNGGRRSGDDEHGVQALRAAVDGLGLRFTDFTRDIHQRFDDFTREIRAALAGVVDGDEQNTAGGF